MGKISNTMQEQVFGARPVLGEIYRQSGHLKLMEYIKSWQIPKNSPDPIFLQVLHRTAEDVCGKIKAEKLLLQLKQKPLVSTIDHLGVWGHPIFVNATTIFSLAFSKAEVVPVLATESVSLNNTTSWSGSILCHQKNLSADLLPLLNPPPQGEENKINRLSFFPDKFKTLPVFSCPAIDSGRYYFVLEQIRNLVKGSFTRAQDDKHFLLKDLLNAGNFSFQACALSSHIWEAVYPSAPQLVYLPLESIVGEYLSHILSDQNHPLTKIIHLPDLWEKYFGSEHTFLFWEIGDNGRRKMIEKNRYLDIAGNLSEMIEKRQIYASSPLCFLVLLYSGLACAGGFTQTTWLTGVKEKTLKLFGEMGESESLEKIQNISTKNFAESLLALLKTGNNNLSPSALDLYLTGRDFYPIFRKKAEEISLKDSIDAFLPEIWKVVCK